MTNKPPRIPQATLNRHRRIGGKILKADRLAYILNSTQQKKTGARWHSPSLSPKLMIVICAISVSVLIVGFGASKYYFDHAADVNRAAAIEQQRLEKIKSAEADACRRKKVEQKADLLGKITYDELYDYGECDK